MINFVSDGETVEVTAPYTVLSGSGMLVGSLFGIVSDDVVSGALAQIVTEGVFTIAKTSALAITAGDLLYWDDTNKVVNKTSSAQKLVGVAMSAAANPSATVVVRLNGAFIS